MLRNHLLLCPLGLILLSLIALNAPAPVRAAEETAKVDAVADVSNHVWSMAYEGRLNDLWQQVRTLPDLKRPDVAALLTRLSEYETHRQEDEKQVRAAFDKQVEQLHKDLEKQDVIAALASTTRAHSLATDPEAFLQTDQVKNLIQTAVHDAVEHERTGRWLDALSLYGGLERLHINEGRFKEPYERVAHHVTMLRLYAPATLFRMSVERAERLGDPAPEPWNIEDDHWQQQLADIEPSMVTDSLKRGWRLHVEGASLKKMLLGGVMSLQRVIATKGLEEAFPTLGDQAKVRPFREYLELVIQAIHTLKDPVKDDESDKILELILKQNAQSIALPERVIVHEFGNGALGELDDYSTIIWPHQKARFERTTRGKFSGVGIQITLINRQLTVVTPLDDTPAHRAHIRAGDRIVSIDGKSTVGMDLDQAVDKITGEEGTEVILGIESPGAAKPREAKLTRSSIRIVSIKGWDRQPGGTWNYYIDPQRLIGYVRLSSFGPNSAEDLDKAITSMLDQKGLNGLIFDLRANPGGRLDAAISISDRFLTEGVIVSTTGGERAMVADKRQTYPDFPIIVLVNQGSASASEIVAGALKVHHRALILGERSFGKGSVQQLYPITRNKAYLKLTTQYYKIPNGQIIHRRPGAKTWGIEPDVPVRMTIAQMAESAQARMILDMLREDENFDPNTVLNREEDADPAAPKENDDAEADRPKREPITSPDQIISRGLDPQLETALLLIQARLLGKRAEG